MKLSIIIPVYNAGRYIEACVLSVIEFLSVNKDIEGEIIIINDGSTDNSAEICESLQIKYPIIAVVNQVNSGVSVARNTGLDNAHGDWVWFVDADDCVAPEIVEIPDCDLLMFGCTHFNDNGVSETYCEKEDTNSSKALFLERHSSFLNQTMWFRRDLIERYRLRFTTGMRMGEDLELQYKYLMICSKPASIAKTLYLYRVVEGSASRNANSRKNIVNDSFTLFQHFQTFIEGHGIKEESWLADRLQRQMKTMLYSIGRANVTISQKKLRGIMDSYSRIGYSCFNSSTMKLAYANVWLYTRVNSFYLWLKGIKTDY